MHDSQLQMEAPLLLRWRWQGCRWRCYACLRCRQSPRRASELPLRSAMRPQRWVCWSASLRYALIFTCHPASGARSRAVHHPLTQVPLRYGVSARGSRSVVCDRADVSHLRPAPPTAPGAPPAPPPQRVWYPLYTDGCVTHMHASSLLVMLMLSCLRRLADRARFVQAVLLLNRDLERLLNAFGLPAVGPRHTAANLARLFAPAMRPMLPPAAQPDKDKRAQQDKGGRPAAQPQRGAP